jgi:predicted dehydrogenase
VALFRLEGGIVAKATTNFDCVMPYRFPITVYGSRGTIRDNRIWSSIFPGQRDWVTIPTILPDSGAVSHHPFQAEIDHLVDSIRSGRQSHANLADAVNTHKAIFALQEAYRTGRPVSV